MLRTLIFTAATVVVCAGAADAGGGVQVKRFSDGGTAKYGPGNSYTYTWANGRVDRGTFQRKAGGVVCVTFDTGRSRCDTLSGDTLTTSAGRAFKVQ